MKRWALLTIVIYMGALAGVLLPTLLAAFWPDTLQYLRANIQQAASLQPADAEFYVGLMIWIGVMALAEAALLVVPVRIAGGRAVKKRHLVWPILAGLFMTALMVGAMWLALNEHLANTPDVRGEHWMYTFGIFILVWVIWTFLFGFYTGGRPPRTFMSRLVKFMLAGSILELLVAVPTHVIARQRNYCCAGFGTFWGLAVGFSVMLFAFGPGVFFLFVRRYFAIRPPAAANQGKTQ